MKTKTSAATGRGYSGTGTVFPPKWNSRKLLGFTQETLAEKAELSAQTVNDIEGCRTWVSDKPLIKLAEALHTTPADLLVPLGETETSSLPDFLKLKNELLFEVSEKIESVFTSHIEKKILIHFWEYSAAGKVLPRFESYVMLTLQNPDME